METSQPKEDWNTPSYPKTQPENKKIVAGVLALLLGSLGIHKFILGYTTEGIIQIVISLVTCGVGGIVPFIEGIIYLVKTDEEFYQTYQVNKRGWF
jgi:TM2 domain-containing membrane protein YozV